MRLNTGGNRHINHVLHIAAVNQLRRPGPGRTYLDRELAEDKDSKEAIRASKRRISDAVRRQLRHDNQTQQRARGGQPGTTLNPTRPVFHPD